MTGQHIYMAAQARYAEHHIARHYYDEAPKQRRDDKPARTRSVRVWIRRHAFAS